MSIDDPGYFTHMLQMVVHEIQNAPAEQHAGIIRRHAVAMTHDHNNAVRTAEQRAARMPWRHW